MISISTQYITLPSRGVWKSGDLSVKTYSEKNDYEIVTPSGRNVVPPKGLCWRVSEVMFQKMVNDNLIWFGKDGNNVPSIKRFLSEVKQGITAITEVDPKNRTVC